MFFNYFPIKCIYVKSNTRKEHPITGGERVNMRFLKDICALWCSALKLQIGQVKLSPGGFVLASPE